MSKQSIIDISGVLLQNSETVSITIVFEIHLSQFSAEEKYREYEIAFYHRHIHKIIVS